MSVLSSPQASRQRIRPDRNAETQTEDRLAKRAGGRIGLLTNLSRKGLLNKLALLHHGRLRLVDQQGTFNFGSPSEAELTASIEVHCSEFYRLVATGGSLGAAESYLKSQWESDDLVSLIRIMCRNADMLESFDGGLARVTAPFCWLSHRLKRNSAGGSQRNIAAHYDLSNEFFSLFLDPTMTYSCGLFADQECSMQEASIAKYDRICRLLNLSPQDHALEIGTGWGGFARYAATEYGCRVTTTTISQNQYDYAARMFQENGLAGQITLLKQDYRHLNGQFDKLVSIEMIEAVGHEFLPTFFDTCGKLLKPGGLFALQAITIPDRRYERYRKSVDFIQRYIFPGGCLPSLGAMLRATATETNLLPVSLEDFSGDYARTLALWRRRFWDNRGQIEQLGLPEKLLRAWHYYFCYCEAAFREQMTGLAQILFSKPQNQ